jgi:hypothetical protein
VIKLQIPQSYEAALAGIKDMDEGTLKQLIDVLGRVSPTFRHKDLIDCVAPQITAIPETDLDEILEVIISLYGARGRLDVSVSELAGHVCNAMEQSDNEELRLLGKDCDAFKDRLTRLLSIESLVYPAKAAGVVSDHDRVFVHSRTSTDLRAIFGSHAEDMPKGAAIIHVLNIVYQHEKGAENFYVAMDSEDIQSLISALQRALSKEIGLKKLLEAAKVQHVVPE